MVYSNDGFLSYIIHASISISHPLLLPEFMGILQKFRQSWGSALIWLHQQWAGRPWWSHQSWSLGNHSSGRQVSGSGASRLQTGTKHRGINASDRYQAVGHQCFRQVPSSGASRLQTGTRQWGIKASGRYQAVGHQGFRQVPGSGVSRLQAGTRQWGIKASWPCWALGSMITESIKPVPHHLSHMLISRYTLGDIGCNPQTRNISLHLCLLMQTWQRP